jgi:hypothetical protein
MALPDDTLTIVLRCASFGTIVAFKRWAEPWAMARGCSSPVLRELEQRYVIAGIMNANALDALDCLRRYRIRADYELAFRIRFRTLTEALDLFTIYFDECCRILGVT